MIKYCLSLLFLGCAALSMAQYQAADQITIDEAFPDDLYLAGGEIKVNAPIGGDLILAGGEIQINDSIAQDLTVGGGDILIRGPIGDDLRIAGGNIDIMAEIGDDLVIFGGSISLEPGSVVKGDLIIYGGEVDMRGEIWGSVKASGGNIKMNGVVRGPSEIAAGVLSIGNEAAFYGDVEYWSEAGKVKFGDSMRSGASHFNDSLAKEAKDYSGPGAIFGGIAFFVMFLLGGFLIIAVIQWALGKYFSIAANQMGNELLKTLGAGGLYLICFPIVIMLAFFIVIGIPIGIFLLVLYIFSLLFGIFVVSLALAYALKQNKDRNWGFWKTSFIALGIAFVLQLVSLIPVAGFLIYTLFLTLGYGGVILAFIAIRKRNRELAKA